MGNSIVKFSSLSKIMLWTSLKVLGKTIDALGHLKEKLHNYNYTTTTTQENYSRVGEDGECRVGKVRAGSTSPRPDHKGFKLQ